MAPDTTGSEDGRSSDPLRSPTGPRRGLVLGAGGSLGAAWMIGALCALEDTCGWDTRAADVILGTSAGALVGSLLAIGARPAELRDHQRGIVAATGPVGRVRIDYDNWVGGARPRIPGPGLGSLGLLCTLAMNPHPMPLTTLLAAAAPTGRGSLSGVRDLFRQLRFEDRWPSNPALRVVAVDLVSATRVLFGTPEAPDTDLASAVTASCAMPSWFEPVRIGGHRFVDGCAWSDTNLDLMAGEGLDEVFVLAPTCARSLDHPRSIPARVERQLRRISSARLMREARMVRDAGTEIRLLVPGPEDLSAMGANLMDPKHRLSVLDMSLRTTTAALAQDEPGTVAPPTPDGKGTDGHSTTR